jgi:hypothetical protein
MLLSENQARSLVRQIALWDLNRGRHHATWKCYLCITCDSRMGGQGLLILAHVVSVSLEPITLDQVGDSAVVHTIHLLLLVIAF